MSEAQDFLQLTLEIGGADPAPFEDALTAAGALSLTLQDAGDDPVLEPAPGTTPLWPSVQLTALFPADTDAQDVLARLQAELGATLPPVKLARLADRAWEREWLKDFRPMRFGRRLWVCPGGQRPSDVPADACMVELDPGLAFGTGTHPTTALCLEWLDGQPLEGASVVDYGCGSGILAVAAALLGAEDILATDIDPQALLATRDNAARNGVAERIRTCLPGELGDAGEGTSDVVLANILAGPLVELAPRIVRLLRGNGRLVLSGLLRSQAGEVAEAYRALGIQLAIDGELDGWVRLAGRK